MSWCLPRDGQKAGAVARNVKGPQVDHVRHGGIDGVFFVGTGSWDLDVAYIERAESRGNLGEKRTEVGVRKSRDVDEGKVLEKRLGRVDESEELVAGESAISELQTSQVARGRRNLVIGSKCR